MPHMQLDKHKLEGSVFCFDPSRQIMSDGDKVAKWLWEISATVRFNLISLNGFRGVEGG